MAVRRRLHLSPAEAPELVRGNQKDQFYSGYISFLLTDISQQLLPLRYLLRWEREIQLLAEALYYGLTTVWGSQTLGEEYCNIVQVSPQQNNSQQQFTAPSLTRRTVAILVQLLGPYMLEKVLGYASQRVENRDLPAELNSRQYRMLEKALDFVEDLITSANLFHLALFYIRGVFYLFSKRVTSIRYLMIHYGLDEGYYQTSNVGVYRLLGWLVVSQLLLKLLKWVWWLYRQRKHHSQLHEVVTTERNNDNSDGSLIFRATRYPGRVIWGGTQSVKLQCPLCLEVCSGVTTTLCGHLFCWQCVTEWTRERSECPVCRTPVEPQTLVALQHFAL